MPGSVARAICLDITEQPMLCELSHRTVQPTSPPKTPRLSELVLSGTILFQEIGFAEQLYEPLGRSLRLELSVVPSQKLLDLLPNGATQFYCFRTGLPPHGKHLVSDTTETAALAHLFRFRLRICAVELGAEQRAAPAPCNLMKCTDGTLTGPEPRRSIIETCRAIAVSSVDTRSQR